MEGKHIVDGLRFCKDGFCEDCPYKKYTINCRDHLVEDALSFIEALQWTNRRLVKTEKEKRRELWDKINRIKEILSEKNGVADSQEFGLHYGQIINYLDQIEEVINHIKE